MAKDKITDYSATAASNTDVGGVNIQGSAPVSNFDDGLRELMSHLADMNAGTSPLADTFKLGDAADLTKGLRFELSGITTSTTRVITAPNLDIDLNPATQAQMEAASATNLFVPPGRVHHHPGVPKAWAFITYSGGTPSLAASYNVASVGDQGTGNPRLTLTTGFSSTSYAVLATAIGNTDRRCVANIVSATVVDIFVLDTNSNLVADGNVAVAIFGDQS